MRRLVLLHTNDVHGRVEGLGRVATLVERVRADEPDAIVLYVDAGDVEETTTWISNATKGAAMHRLLSAAGCAASVVGNAAWLRYGAAVCEQHARVASYPILLANLRLADGRPVSGTRDRALVQGAGFVGVTDPARANHPDNWDLFGLAELDLVGVVRANAAALRSEGARVVVVLSHLGLDGDRRLAAEVQGEVDVVLGAHSHHLLPEGEWVGGVLVAQAGEYAQHLGRVDIATGRPQASVLEVGAGVPVHPAVAEAVAAAELEVAAIVNEVIGVLGSPLDVDGVAEILRRRLDAQVAIVTEGANLTAPLPAGPLRRGELWQVCDSSANPGVTTMTGAQLRQVIARGRDGGFMRETTRALRGRPRGRLGVAGLDEIDAEASYRVAGTDWELEPYGGMVEAEWRLEVEYDFPTITREAIEESLRPA